MMHDQKRTMYVKALVLYLLTWTSGVVPLNFTEINPTTTSSSGSSFIFPINGNVYPSGGFTVTIGIGNPPKPYILAINSGTDLTWVACADAKPTPANPYHPQDTIKLQDPECKSLGTLGEVDMSPASNATCPYMIIYADNADSTGILVRDSFPLRLKNGTTITPRLTFGCGTPSIYDKDIVHKPGDGMLGLGKGNSGILKQLRETGVIRSVAAHCFSAQGGGSLFIGDVPASENMTWKQIEKLDDEHYNLGSADILFAGEATDIKGLEIIFDSGSTYTYLISEAYQALLDLVTKNLNGSPLTDAPHDTALPMCWGASKPITSIGEVSGYFKPWVLNFTGEQNVLFEMRPESYLIISDKGNVCLGILDNEDSGFEEVDNLIGDISMHDKLVIYDNENGRVGWATENCTRTF